ncbi:MAG: hypothetical protein LBS12_06875 [Prevotellaceae bacterium]|jgi:hypothetical protein|nr:hypothetical protein [Prevotellaceae bacterium]
MKHFFLIAILFFSLSAWGQTRVVEIEQLSTAYGAAPTVTFRVYWDTAPVGAKHLDSVWVFVDFQRINAGNVLDSWAPATLTTPATVSAGTPSYPFQPTARGFYLRGNAAGAFSSTVTVALQNLADAKFNWCAYATDYPPNATLGAAHYDLHGTPPFEINGSSLGSGVRTFSGECITTLTDATGCPGLIPTPPTAPILTASPDSICTGDTTTLAATAADAAFYSFDDGATWIATNAATFSPTATTEYPVAIKNAAGCSVTGAPVTVTVVPPPVPVFINPPATYCADSTFDLTASAGAGSSYCFTQTYTGASHNPYLSGNDTDAGVDCDFPTVEYCSPSGDSVFTVRMPESGSVTICVRAWNAFGCPADTCITISATPLPAFALISTQGTDAQTISLEQPVTTIRYTTTDAYSAATAVTVTGLPAGLSYTWNAPNIEITGTAAASATVGAHSYTVTAAGNCGTTTTQGVITIAGNFFSMVTTNPDSVYFSVNFTGTLYIDWGDGTSTYTTGNGQKKHFYTDGLTAHTVTAQAPVITYLHCISNKLTALDVTQAPALTSLLCYDNLLTALDVRQNTAATYLNCHTNQLSALDVSKNTALLVLACNNNQLSALDVRQNTAATYLDCNTNQLSALDVRQNPALRTLNCGSNKLPSLDVTQCTLLTSLRCDDNLLTSLDVTQHPALLYLHCAHNLLPSLDISRNTAATYLDCSYNLLSSLVVTPHSALRTLYCSSNKLTTLNVTQNTLLRDLQCSINQLSELDVTQNTDLRGLQCNSNQLKVLNLWENTLLTGLQCNSNILDSLDLQRNPLLNAVQCRGNRLTKLNITTCTVLTQLYCDGNLLPQLDVSNNTNLIILSFNSNLISSMDLSANTALTYLSLSGNQFTELDLTGNPALTTVACRSNLFTATALNDLFHTLHSNPLPDKTVYIYNNPKSNPGAGTGTAGCDQSIATGRGWVVNTAAY